MTVHGMATQWHTERRRPTHEELVAATMTRLEALQLAPNERRADWRLVPPNWRTLLTDGFTALTRGQMPLQGVGLTGPAGCGKTYALAALVRAYVIAGIQRTLNENFGHVAWCSWPWAVQRARTMAMQSQQEVTRWLTRMTDATMLVLDDLGAERTRAAAGEDYAIGLLDLILDGRVRAGMVTFYSTNLHETELGKLYGSRVYSRLVGPNPLLTVRGPDRRMERRV